MDSIKYHVDKEHTQLALDAFNWCSLNLRHWSCPGRDLAYSDMRLPKLNAPTFAMKRHVCKLQTPATTLDRNN